MSLSSIRPSIFMPKSKAPSKILLKNFHASASSHACRVYDPIRNEHDFHTIMMLSTTANQPLITYWTASYCPPCRTIKPLLHDLLKNSGDRWNLMFAEVEVDAPDSFMPEFMMRYSIRTLPTLLPMYRGEPEVQRRLVDTRLMTDRGKLEEWLEEVNRSRGGGGKASGLFASIFGGY